MINLYGNGLIGRVDVHYDSTLVEDDEEGGYYSVSRRDERFFYFKDHLGSTRLGGALNMKENLIDIHKKKITKLKFKMPSRSQIHMTLDENSDIISAQDYYPYGEILRSYTLGSGANNKYYFTEKERDTETNYDYFGARYYDSELGRWLQVDPLNQYAGSYTYCGNNPLRIIDMDGLYGEDVHFDLTYYMAVVVMGSSHIEALTIANSNQGIDDNLLTSSLNPINWDNERTLHFKSKSSLNAVGKLFNETTSISNSEFGKYLHSYQDIFFAHADFYALNKDGTMGHWPDHMYVDEVAENGILKESTIKMIQGVYDLMKKRNRGKVNISFENLIQSLQNFVFKYGDFKGINQIAKQNNKGSKNWWFNDINEKYDNEYSARN